MYINVTVRVKPDKYTYEPCGEAGFSMDISEEVLLQMNFSGVLGALPKVAYQDLLNSKNKSAEEENESE